jgi:hypothetical protein
VDVEERHCAQGDVIAREGVEVCDSSRAREDVAVEERYLLRPARRAARMQHERNVVRHGSVERGRGSGRELDAVDGQEAKTGG